MWSTLFSSRSSGCNPVASSIRRPSEATNRTIVEYGSFNRSTMARVCSGFTVQPAARLPDVAVPFRPSQRHAHHQTQAAERGPAVLLRLLGEAILNGFAVDGADVPVSEVGRHIGSQAETY